MRTRVSGQRNAGWQSTRRCRLYRCGGRLSVTKFEVQRGGSQHRDRADQCRHKQSGDNEGSPPTGGASSSLDLADSEDERKREHKDQGQHPPAISTHQFAAAPERMQPTGALKHCGRRKDRPLRDQQQLEYENQNRDEEQAEQQDHQTADIQRNGADDNEDDCRPKRGQQCERDARDDPYDRPPFFGPPSVRAGG